MKRIRVFGNTVYLWWWRRLIKRPFSVDRYGGRNQCLGFRLGWIILDWCTR